LKLEPITFILSIKRRQPFALALNVIEFSFRLRLNRKF
jgi:hypothetical protein